jgi:ribonucleoside-triphosphate reductase
MNFFDKGDPSQGGMPYRFPISTINISKQWDEKEQQYIVEDKKFLKSVCKKDIYRYNIFVSQGQKVASCCRLMNNNELLELAGQSNSFGGGSSISLGSHRVLTTNFVRVALEAESVEDFYNILEERISDSAKILKAHKQLLTLLTENGLQPFILNGWIQMSRLFSTFGILGSVEAEEILKKRFKDEILKTSDLMEDILIFFNDKVSEYSKLENIIGNIEQIPAESMAVRLSKVDKLLYSEKDIPWNIYSNQFIPLWDTESSIWERMDKDGKYNQLLTGGGIVHINTGEHVTSTQAEKLIEYSIGCGCEHFAITGTFIKCEDCHVVLGNADKCPMCGKDIVEKTARVVGFWTPVSSWSKAKIKYDHERRKEYMNGDFDIEDNLSHM